MILTVVLVVVLFTGLVLVQTGVVPWFIKAEGERLRSQVDELAAQLRGQLARVEAQQRAMTESVVTLKSYALDKTVPGSGEFADEAGNDRHFFNALVKELGDRLGARIWIVEDTGRIIGEAAGAPNLQSLNDLDMPMAVPLRSLLAQPGEGLRHTQFRSASGEHTLVVQPVPDSAWLLALDVPTRRLNERITVLQHPWPLAVLMLVSTLTLLRSLHQHQARLIEELPALLQSESAGVREQSAQLPPLLREMDEQMAALARFAICVAQENEKLLQMPEENANRVAMLTESVINVVQAMYAIQQAGAQIADSAGNLVQLSSRAYSFALHQEEGVFAVEARNLAQRCARSSKDLRALITDALMQSESGAKPMQSNSVLIEEVYSVANSLLQRAGMVTPAG